MSCHSSYFQLKLKTMRKSIALSSLLFVSVLLFFGCTKPGWFAKNFTAITTNYVDVLATNQTTGEITVVRKPVYSYAKDPTTEANVKEGAGAVGGFWGVGGIATTLAGALYGGIITIMNMRNKKANITLAQGTEVALELFKAISPAIEARFKETIINNQQATGTKETIEKIVDNDVDQSAARATAKTLVAASKPTKHL